MEEDLPEEILPEEILSEEVLPEAEEASDDLPEDGEDGTLDMDGIVARIPVPVTTATDLNEDKDEDETGNVDDVDDGTESSDDAEDGEYEIKALSGTLRVELHTGRAYGGNGTLVNAGKNVSSVTLSKAARSLFTVESISGRRFRVYPIKKGTGSVTVQFKDGTKQTVSVTVYDKYVATDMSVIVNGPRDGSTLFMTKSGVTMKVGVTLTPATATSTVSFKSSNTRVARVSSDGTLTLLRTGKFVLTVTTSSGLRRRMTLSVVNPYTVKSFTLTYNGKSYSGSKAIPWSANDKLVLGRNVVTVGGANYPASASGFSWTSSAKKVATVASDGTVTIKKAGTVTFTLKAPNGKKARIKFKFIQPLTAINITPSASVEVMPGKTVQLKASLSPSSASGLVNLTWYSGNTKIARVDQKGVVTGVKKGTTYIYCKDTVSGIYARKSVVVSAPPAYRAIVAVEGSDLTDIPSNYKGTTYYLHGYLARTADQNMIVKTLKMQNYGGSKWSISQMHNSSASKVLSAIDRVASKANSHDVTLFFFMGHGLSDGSLYFYNGSIISPSTLKAHLDKVPGKVIVMLGSCNSGRYVSRGDDGTGFSSAIISTFGVG